MSQIPDYKWTREEAAFVKVMWGGKADPAMQKAVLKHVVEMLGGINALGFDPENSQLTAFNAGRRWVARQLQNAIVDPLPKEATHESDGRVVPTATERAAAAERTKRATFRA